MTNKFSSVLCRHSRMLFDWRRTTPLLAAIAQTVRPGDVVVDLGCGLGFLSLAAAKAGARRVYAIDVDGESLEFARWQATQLGVAKKIVFLGDHSFNIDLTEKADLLIQETVGSLAFDENFLPTLCDAKKRLLKKSARIIPEEVILFGVPVGSKRRLLGKPKILASVVTQKVRRPTLTLCKEWKLGKPSKIAGLLAWPKIIWAPNLTTDAGPFNPKTHWGQTLLPFRNGPQKQETFKALIKIYPHPSDPVHYSETVWSFV